MLQLYSVALASNEICSVMFTGEYVPICSVDGQTCDNDFKRQPMAVLAISFQLSEKVELSK